ncbi:hypothetical protein HYQ46_009892 [Verticillium longisporum]|nr:hypothetical protein HYQ46_009892 [Verticillium longisporum]
MWRAGQLAVEFIGVIDLADVKLGLEGDGAALLTLTLARVCVKVIEKAEEGGEAGLRARVRVVKVASRLKNVVPVVANPNIVRNSCSFIIGSEVAAWEARTRPSWPSLVAFRPPWESGSALD